MVGLGLPARFALGAAIGVPDSFRRARATLLLGILMAIVSKPTTVMSGTCLERFKTSVRGPGQNFVIKFSAAFGISLASRYTSFLVATWTIMGLSGGRFFASNSFFTASAFNASAPRP